MERPTKKFKTSGGTEVEIYTYITGGENREIQNIILKDVKVDTDGSVSGLNGNVTSLAQDKTIELMVVSMNDNKEDVLKEVMELPLNEFEEVVEQLNKVQGGIDKKKEKK